MTAVYRDNEEVFRQFNRYSGNAKSLVRKALTSVTNVGEALIPQKLEQVITNTVLYLLPEMAVINPEFDNQKLHEFNRLIKLPKQGGAMGEGGRTPTRNAQYSRDGVRMKVVRRKGAVTNFLQDTSQKYLDAAATEMENHLYAHVLDLVGYMYYGNSTANPYEFSGLDHFINGQKNRINKVAGGEVPTSLKFLDDMIDNNTRKQGAHHRKCFLMSPEMLSKVSRLLENVRIIQGLNGAGLTHIEIAGGWRLNAYRNIPIIESTYTRPVEQMGNIAVTKVDTGVIPPGTYYFEVTPVTYNGEQLASTVQSITVPAGGAASISIGFTPHEGAFQYRIYVGTNATNGTLKAITSAFQYDVDGTIIGDINSYTFTSNPITAGLEVTGTMANDVPPRATGGVAPENIYMWDLDKIQGLGKFAYTNTAGSKFQGLVTVQDIYPDDDYLPFLVKTYGALVPSFSDSSSIVRGLRVE